MSGSTACWILSSCFLWIRSADSIRFLILALKMSSSLVARISCSPSSYIRENINHLFENKQWEAESAFFHELLISWYVSLCHYFLHTSGCCSPSSSLRMIWQILLHSKKRFSSKQMAEMFPKTPKLEGSHLRALKYSSMAREKFFLWNRDKKGELIFPCQWLIHWRHCYFS